MTIQQTIRRICVIGTGQIGPGIAQTCAHAGYDTVLVGRTEAGLMQARVKIEANLAAMLPFGLVNAQSIVTLWQRLRFQVGLEGAHDCDLLIEAVTEDTNLKQSLFASWERQISADAVMLSSTSSIRASDIARDLVHPGRMLVGHYFNPPHLVPLVEVAPGVHTRPDVIDTVMSFLHTTGHVPVVCKKEVPGFIANRLQGAMWREALALVQHGVATAGEIDVVLKNSFGARTPVLGIFEHLDLVGLPTVYAIHSYMIGDLDTQSSPNPLLKEHMDKGELGASVGQGFYAWGPGGKSATEVIRARDTQLLELAQKRKLRVGS